jgi:hypothetical protein
LPDDISGSGEPRKRRRPRSTRKAKYSKIDGKTARKAAQAYELEQKKRDFERQKKKPKEEAEESRWDKLKDKLDNALHRARR